MKRGVGAAARGFTLIEMLVVMGLLSMIFAAVIAGRPKAAQLRLQTEVGTVMAELARARARAMATNREAVVRIDTETRRITVENSSRELPAGMAVGLTIADSERSGQSGGLRFYPDGQSSGGEITLALDGRALRIAINWLTGQPKLVP